MSTYVYGFTRSSHPLPIDGVSGVGTTMPSLRIVRGQDLAAVVSDAPEGLRPKRRDLEAHQRVLEALCAAGTVLPMRFGTLAPDDTAVATELESSAGRYQRLLDELDGSVEVNVKAAHREDPLLRDVLYHHPALRRRNEALRASGGGSQQDRLEFGERVAEAVEQRRARDAEWLMAGLRPHAARVKLGPAVDGCFVNASFLVAIDDLEAFEAVADRLQREIVDVADLDLYGPLPPYSFVSADGATG
jgi:hypothetical protein